MNCTTVITGFPVMKEARSRPDWPSFSCSPAKSYISEESAQHAGALTWLSCQKLQEKKNLPLLHRLGRSHKGIPAWTEVTHTRSRLRKCLLSGYPAACSPELRGCRRRPAGLSAIYPGTRLPGYRRAHADVSVKPAAFVFLICIR